MPADPHPTTTTAAHRATTTTRAARTTTANTRGATRTTRSATSTSIATSSTPTPSQTPAAAASGPSGAMIGGIAVGVVAVLGLVGLIFYKRRKRASVAAAEQSAHNKNLKELPRGMSEMRGGEGSSGGASHNAISGPMALAPEQGIDAAPQHRPEAQFREQQQFRPGMRDELFAQPGSALHASHSNKSNGSGQRSGGNGNNYGAAPGPVSREIQDIHRNNSKNNMNEKQQLDNTGDYYDDHLDFYSNEPDVPTIGAKRDVPQARDLTHGNLTPAPQYYLGKEDIDPRRDLRGMDNPDSYVGKNEDLHDPRQGPPPITNGGKNDNSKAEAAASPRSSYSSDGEAYLTLEQAQGAHNRKIMGHKESIGSVQMLMEHSLSPPSTGKPQMHSGAISESTVSMIPSLPPATSPMPAFNGGGNNNISSSKSDLSSLPSPNRSPGASGPIPPAPNSNGQNHRPPPPPSAPVLTDDPYAESAFSEDFYDDRSHVSGVGYRSPGGPNNNHPRQHQHPHPHPPPLHIQQGNGAYPGGGRGSPYSPQNMSPSYYSPQQHNGPPQRPYHPGGSPYGSHHSPRGPPSSHGYSSPSPGFGPSQHPPYNGGGGGHHGHQGQGYRPHPGQRDPHNQGPNNGGY
ncbi:hypothetical protein BGZ83_007333 [Gryganskiella cystojenkinii]|nr:hypothetical protein BGZ83_007333 [Gryganskiella cystojenkinii]